MMNSEFKQKIIGKLQSSIHNNYDDNYDSALFGDLPPEKGGIKEYVRKTFIYPNYIAKCNVKNYIDRTIDKTIDVLINYFDDFNYLYDNLENDKSKELLIDLIAYRVLGNKQVKLSVNNQNYWDSIKIAENLITDKNDYFETGFKNWKIYRYNLEKIGYEICLYLYGIGVVVDFMLEQYAYKDIHKLICAKEGDVVIDAGACWGDTALYFSSKVKEKGSVYSFEFIPQNIDFFNKNLSLNSKLSGNINLIKRPLWDIQDLDVYFVDDGPASKVSFEELKNYDGKVKTTTIDVFIKENNIHKVDFIKMDIEGAELNALKGAINTITQFKPNLAIAIYHSLDDFTQIPKWINNLGLGYKLYLGHYTIHDGETVLFATIE
jgi:FkbM family methyltransferase